MECEHFKRHGILFLYHELSPSDRQLMEAHIRGCDFCREEIENARQTRALLPYAATADVPEVHVSVPEVRLEKAISSARPALPELVSSLSSLFRRNLKYLVPAFTIMIVLCTCLSLQKTYVTKHIQEPSSGMLSWNGDTDSFNKVHNQIADMENPERSLYEITEGVERRWSQDTLYRVRELYSRDEEITSIRDEINQF